MFRSKIGGFVPPIQGANADQHSTVEAEVEMHLRSPMQQATTGNLVGCQFRLKYLHSEPYVHTDGLPEDPSALTRRLPPWR
jgi:hypothetical protein